MPQTLLSSHLILRELEPSDLTAVFNYSSQPEYARFLPHPHAASIEDFKPIFEDIISGLPLTTLIFFEFEFSTVDFSSRCV